MNPFQNNFRQQLERVHRYLLRVENQNRNSVEYDDDIWSFFQNCWHLKDWIKNDPSVPNAVKNKIEDDVRKYESLLICADLANRSKHLSLNKSVRKDATAIGRSVTIQLGDPLNSVRAEQNDSGTIFQEYIIALDDGSTRVALTIARQAVADWEAILQNYGLL